MADNAFTLLFEAVTADLESGIGRVNQALGYTRVQANDTKNPINELFGAMQSSSDKAIAGMMKGTETWHKATLNILSDLEIKFVQLASHKLINWVQSELGMTEATNIGNSARTASDEAASSTSLGMQAQKAITSIFNDAKEVFSGIFAFLSPVMGPAAAGPAATGSASVSALASGITYAESGAWNIPDNTLAYLHAGEMVVPQSFASSLRAGNGFGSGGDSYTININAVDTQTGTQFLKNNAATIASALSSQVRNFNRNVPVWKS